MADQQQQTIEQGKTACVIGAGCSGLSSIKALIDAGMQVDAFEMSDDIGGNWYAANPNGRSACYESLHIDTSKTRLQFEDFPIPEHYPDFPHHSQIFEYFCSYAEHFNLRQQIRFNHEVVHAEPLLGDRWRVTVQALEPLSREAIGPALVQEYDYLFICNGHHWDKRLPEFEGEFSGVRMHSHDYRSPFEPADLVGKQVLVVGSGNSAMDICSELSQRPLAKKLWISTRRGFYVFPKFMFGKPTDKSSLPWWVPAAVQRFILRLVYRIIVGPMQNYGLPKPDFKPMQSHPSVSGEFLMRKVSGDIDYKPNIKKLLGDEVEFVDGTVEQVDAIVYATGYNVSFPFLPVEVVAVNENHVSLFKRIVLPERPTLFFIGLAQPLPTLINLAEQQMKLVSQLLQGNYQLPSATAMQQQIAADEKRDLGDFYDSPRHKMQIDFNHYVHDIQREVKRGRKRAAV